jgi:four helix bundle protein
MDNSANHKVPYDLEERTFQFAKAIRLFIRTLPNSLSIIEDSKQLIRASGSVGANYREANEALSKKDFLLRMRISRKEAKECIYWLRLVIETNQIENITNAQKLLQEATELKKILSSIIEKSTK